MLHDSGLIWKKKNVCSQSRYIFEQNIFSEKQDCANATASFYDDIATSDFFFLSKVKIYFNGRNWEHHRRESVELRPIDYSN